MHEDEVVTPHDSGGQASRFAHEIEVNFKANNRRFILKEEQIAKASRFQLDFELAKFSFSTPDDNLR